MTRRPPTGAASCGHRRLRPRPVASAARSLACVGVATSLRARQVAPRSSVRAAHTQSAAAGIRGVSLAGLGGGGGGEATAAVDDWQRKGGSWRQKVRGVCLRGRRLSDVGAGEAARGGQKQHPAPSRQVASHKNTIGAADSRIGRAAAQQRIMIAVGCTFSGRKKTKKKAGGCCAES
eukprot:COSAG01_NODE_801_length_13466_cov_585.329693_11_plen_177_part_00